MILSIFIFDPLLPGPKYWIEAWETGDGRRETGVGTGERGDRRREAPLCCRLQSSDFQLRAGDRSCDMDARSTSSLPSSISQLPSSQTLPSARLPFRPGRQERSRFPSVEWVANLTPPDHSESARTGYRPEVAGEGAASGGYREEGVGEALNGTQAVNRESVAEDSRFPAPSQVCRRTRAAKS